MGIFEKILQEHEPAAVTLTPPQAFVALIVGTVNADGDISAEEAARVRQVFESTRLFGPSSGVAFQPVLTDVMALIERHGAGAIVELAAKALPLPLHAPVFAMAVDLVLADGQAGTNERKFIDVLQDLLHIADDDAMKIVDVMLLKNSA